MSHTPGPWMYRRPEVGPHTPIGERESWPFHIDQQGTEGRMNWGILIAKCWAHAPGSAEANARLLAAAPDLLRELKNLTDFVSARVNLLGGNERLMADAGEAIKDPIAAIAKAEGASA